MSSPIELFSSRAAEYARYRPHYPPSLFEYLASVAPGRALAWDCATGNGQSAVPLAAFFDRVVATDASAAQIARAARHERITYRVADAAASGLADASVDLVMVSQALHWLDLDAFYAEVQRVLVPRGVFAVSSYGSATLDTPALSESFSGFEHGTVGEYWPPGRSGVGEALRQVPFPFEELAIPAFSLTAAWSFEEVIGYARSWSATARYVEQHGVDPTRILADALRPLWGGDETATHTVTWPFVVRVGRRRCAPRA